MKQQICPLPRAERKQPRCLEAAKQKFAQAFNADGSALPFASCWWWGISDAEPRASRPTGRMPCLPSLRPPSFIVDVMNACVRKNVGSSRVVVRPCNGMMSHLRSEGLRVRRFVAVVG